MSVVEPYVYGAFWATAMGSIYIASSQSPSPPRDSDCTRIGEGLYNYYNPRSILMLSV